MGNIHKPCFLPMAADLFISYISTPPPSLLLHFVGWALGSSSSTLQRNGGEGLWLARFY